MTGQRAVPWIDGVDLVIGLDTPAGEALVTIRSPDTPIGPGSTLSPVTIVNAIPVRTAGLLVGRGAMPPVLTRPSVVGAERSRDRSEAAYREHARRLARAIDQRGGG